MKELAVVAGNGAVLLGRTLTCDAHYKRPVRLVTHAHSDHLLHLDASLRECEAVLATPLTRDFLGILKGQRAARKIHPLPYGQAYEREGEKLTLYSAHHIVGSAQALLQTAEGGRVVLFGVRDLVVVRTPDTTLVLPRARAADLKALLKELGEGA
jgi:putative mRNA 3-end processing factor